MVKLKIQMILLMQRNQVEYPYKITMVLMLIMKMLGLENM